MNAVSISLMSVAAFAVSDTPNSGGIIICPINKYNFHLLEDLVSGVL